MTKIDASNWENYKDQVVKFSSLSKHEYKAEGLSFETQIQEAILLNYDIQSSQYTLKLPDGNTITRSLAHIFSID